MNTKRIFALLMCAAMLLSMIPVVVLSTSAAEIEGDWITYRNAVEYPVEGEEVDPDKVYPPAPGYEYTEEGCVVLQPDWTDITPYFTIQTKDKQSIKDGIYLEFRVDEFSYGGASGAADHWICINLNTEANVCPGSTEYGGGWLTLLRGNWGDGCVAEPHITDPKTEEFGGSFIRHGGQNGIGLKYDDEGRSVITFEITWDGSAYEMKINGYVMPGGDQTSALLEKLSSAGDFYIGITMQTGEKNGTAGLTILKYGTCEADATTPVGSDRKDPEPNEIIIADIADPSTVEANKPAILWSTDTCIMKNGTNCAFTVLGDDTWRVKASDPGITWTFGAKNSWSYAAEDFPVFGMLVRNLLGAEDGAFWYCAGDVSQPSGAAMSPFSIYEGEFYKDVEGNEYIFLPFDITDLWEGRINAMRIDLSNFNLENPEFDICFAGMFRSEEEASAYAKEYLIAKGVDVSATDAPSETTAEPDTEASDTSALDTNASDTTNIVGESSEEDTNGMSENGCKSVIGMGTVAVLTVASAFVALKKKD